MWLKSWGKKKFIFVNPFCSGRDCGQPKLILEHSQDSTWHHTLQLPPGGIFPPAESHISWKMKTFQQQIKPRPARAGKVQAVNRNPRGGAVCSGQLLTGRQDRDGSSSAQPRNATDALMDPGRQGSNPQEGEVRGQDLEKYFKN